VLGVDLGWCGRGCCVNSGGRNRAGIRACAGAAERGVELFDWNCHDMQPGISALQQAGCSMWRGWQHTLSWCATSALVMLHSGTHLLVAPSFFIDWCSMLRSPAQRLLFGGQLCTAGVLGCIRSGTGLSALQKCVGCQTWCCTSAAACCDKGSHSATSTAGVWWPTAADVSCSGANAVRCLDLLLMPAGTDPKCG
jgi:hypothetical protein